MENKKAHILVVDDEEINLDIIIDLFEERYDVTTAIDGKIAWQILEENPTRFDAILLDRVMPHMSGIQVLEKIKLHPALRYCPVIFQSAKADLSDISEGLSAGAYYYLTKPFEKNALLSIVETAVHEHRQVIEIQRDIENNKLILCLLDTASFNFKTLQDARSIALLLSHAYPNPSAIIMGLTELMINAIEHGNLGITYAEKSVLNNDGTWVDEVNQRLQQKENKHKIAYISYQRNKDNIVINIKDMGDGFNWHEYMDFEPNRMMDNHGRGIAVANKLSFSSIEYKGNGNEVCAILNTD